MMVGRISPAWSAVRIRRLLGGGSSRVFNRLLAASRLIVCMSSRIITLTLASSGGKASWCLSCLTWAILIAAPSGAM